MDDPGPGFWRSPPTRVERGPLEQVLAPVVDVEASVRTTSMMVRRTTSLTAAAQPAVGAAVAVDVAEHLPAGSPAGGGDRAMHRAAGPLRSERDGDPLDVLCALAPADPHEQTAVADGRVADDGEVLDVGGRRVRWRAARWPSRARRGAGRGASSGGSGRRSAARSRWRASRPSAAERDVHPAAGSNPELTEAEVQTPWTNTITADYAIAAPDGVTVTF
jgi:hypothetical protein